MTAPQDFHFTDSDTESNSSKRDPSEILDFKRIVELDTPRGKRPGKLIIVRPLDKIKDWRETDPDMAWKTLVVADIAVLEAIPAAIDEYQNTIPAIPAGAMFRNQIIFPGMLCKAWRDQIGNTLIGVLHLGPNEKGQPPFLWRSLAKVSAATDLGRRFMMRFPQFLIPVPREPEAAAAAEQWATDPWGQSAAPVTAAAPALASSDPWGQAQPAQSHAAPVSAPPQGGWTQTDDPWAQAPAAAVTPAQAAPMNTLQQIQAAQRNAQGAPQLEDPPF
jgi:hypothetical protein